MVLFSPFTHSSLFVVLSCILFILRTTTAAPSSPPPSAFSPCTITEESVSILTYPFAHPSSLPQLLRDPRIYPYETFLEYTDQGEFQNWTVIRLENEFVSVFVLPGVGGKIWYAEVKEGKQQTRNRNPKSASNDDAVASSSSSREFVYKNDVLKFRDLGLRGPWTSGGIEFNFGVVGHTPSTAADVNYRLMKDQNDGSVTCVVGSMDLPSRTFWRVEVRLEPGKAKFETHPVWYNPTPVRQSYYVWMNSATKTEDDLEICFSGNKYLQHDGDALSWPIDSKGRDLSIYKDNDFGGSKSYHIVGKYNDFFGAYYRKKGLGHAHWGEYSDTPGKKAFMWSLSDAGKIWEKLLTDTSGQYMEMQAGRLFVQFMPQRGHTNPIRRAFFDPYLTDSWMEVWAPIGNIGGINDVSPSGALSVSSAQFRSESVVVISVAAFETISSAKLEVKQNGKLLYSHSFDLRPMQTVTHQVPYNVSLGFQVQVDAMSLFWSNLPSKSLDIDRPFSTDKSPQIPEIEQLIAEGRDLMAGRYIQQAIDSFDAVLKMNPWTKDALLCRAELFYRSGLYDKGLDLVDRVLQLDSYHPEANYLAGVLYRAKTLFVNADECFGWSLRSLSFRSNALAQKAELALLQKNPLLAAKLARKSLDYNAYSVPALQTLAIAARIEDDSGVAIDALLRLLAIDPLNHFARFEQYLWNPSEQMLHNFQDLIRCEFPEHLYLELALLYRSRGSDKEAMDLLTLGVELTENALLELWIAYLIDLTSAGKFSVHLKMAHEYAHPLPNPYRRESIEMLEWTITKDDSWEWKYLLGLNLWAKQRTAEASELLNEVGNSPNSASFYVSRAVLLNKEWSVDPEKDLLRSLELGSSDWNIWIQLISYYQANGRWTEALSRTAAAYEKFPLVSDVALAHVRSLIHETRPSEALVVLHSTTVLPAEGARDSRTLWEWSHSLDAIQKIQNSSFAASILVLQDGYLWPEHIGVGRPYDPDERMFDFLLGSSYGSLGSEKEKMLYFDRVVNYTFTYSLSGQSVSFSGSGRMEDFLAFVVLKLVGDVQKANELIDNIAKESSHDVSQQWVVACARHETGKLSELKKEYPSIFEGFAYLLLEESLRVVLERVPEAVNGDVCLNF